MSNPSSVILTRIFIAVLLNLSLALLCACQAPEEKPESPESPAPEPVESASIKLATTTSCDNSGLLAYLLPVFKEETGIQVDVIAVGTGAALEMGKNGDVDIVLVHAPESEEEFINEGYGVERYYVAQNEFVIVGPESDPAGIGEISIAADAFLKFMDTETTFVSRGDNSGTHKREMSIWDLAGVTPEGAWYVEAGQGMGAVLTMTDEMEAYTLTDTGTFYSMIDDLDLVILLSGDEALENIYSIIPLSREMHPDLKHDEAMVLVEWLTSDEAAEMINTFEVNGHVLFSVVK
jgi:tungstate transport system substrate-binding protein